jgi:hypothetical protein
MKKIFLSLLVLAVIALCAEMDAARATPSTTFYTPATSDVQPFGVFHFGVDNYFTIGKKGANKGALPTDLTLPEVGVLPYEKLQLEVGADILEPSDHPFFFNFKFGTPEGAIFDGSPAINIGMFDVGTHGSVSGPGDVRTDYDIADIIIGKTLPFGLGRLHAGAYYGNAAALVDKNGVKANTGFMVGWDKGIVHTKDNSGEYDKWVFAADYASGKNYIGGGGVGVYHYFTKDISLLMGPVWFNEPAVAGPNPGAKWTWTTQLDINY